MPQVHGGRVSWPGLDAVVKLLAARVRPPERTDSAVGTRASDRPWISSHRSSKVLSQRPSGNPLLVRHPVRVPREQPVGDPDLET